MTEGNEPHENVAPVFIYEDQDGSLKYPELKHLDKTIGRESSNIVGLFEEKITLLLTKKNEKLKAYCHFYASRRENREEGFYIVYEETYSDHFFQDLQRFGEIALGAIELSLADIKDNSVFKNISIFDIYDENSNKIQSHNGFSFSGLDLEALRQALANKEKLTYIGGVSPALSNFIKNMLNNVPDFPILISSEQRKLFGINIQIKLNVTELLCTEDTQKILNEYREKLRREKEEKERKARIESAKQTIKEPISQLKSCNWSEFEVDDHLFKNCSSLSPSRYTKSDFTRNLFRLINNAGYEHMLDWGIIHYELSKQPIYTQLINSPSTGSENSHEVTTPTKAKRNLKFGVTSDYIYILKSPYFLILIALIILIFFFSYIGGDISNFKNYIENCTINFGD
jgi:hypothetical protein